MAETWFHFERSILKVDLLSTNLYVIIHFNLKFSNVSLNLYCYSKCIDLKLADL